MNCVLKEIEIERIYTVTEVAELMHLHPVTIRRFIREKKLLALKGGKTWRIPHSILTQFYRDYLK